MTGANGDGVSFFENQNEIMGIGATNNDLIWYFTAYDANGDHQPLGCCRIETSDMLTLSYYYNGQIGREGLPYTYNLFDKINDKYKKYLPTTSRFEGAVDWSKILNTVTSGSTSAMNNDIHTSSQYLSAYTDAYTIPRLQSY